MSLILLYIGTRYDVCKCNSLRHMTIDSYFVTFDLRLWPSSSVNVTFILIIRLTLGCCVLVPSMKFEGSIEFEIWAIVLRKHKFTMTSSSIRFLWDLNTNWPRVYQSHILNFILFEHKRAEIQSREVNREWLRKNDYYVTMTLTKGHKIQ